MARIRIISPDGKSATVPEENLQKALDRGFRLAKEPTMSDYGKVALPVLKEVGSQIFGDVGRFAKGAVRGASLGTIFPELPRPEGIYPEKSGFETAGEYAGTVLPLIGAGMTGGAALGGAAALRGAGIFGQAIARGVGTGLTYAGAEGAAQGLPISETTKKMAKTGSLFGGFGIVGQGMGYLRKLFGDDIAESLANHFINTPRKLAEKFVEQGKKTSPGKQYLQETTLPGFKSREQVYDKAGEELFKLGNQIRFKLSEYGEAIKRPNVPEVQIKGKPLLEYKPGGKQEIRPSGYGTDLPIATPSTRKEIVPEKRLSFEGNREEMERDVFGMPIRLEKKGIESGLQPPSVLGGFERTIPVGSEPIIEPVTGGRSGLAEATRSLRPLPEVGLKAQRPGTVNLIETAEAIDPIKSGLDIGTEKGSLSKLNLIQKGFLEKNGENVSIDQAMILKRKLDDLVGNVYLKGYDAKTAIKSDAYENMANNLRKQIYSIDSELGELAAQESLMIRIRTGLKPEIAEAGGSRLPFGLWSTLVNALEGSRAANFLAKSLDKTMGQSLPIVSRAAKVGSRIGVANYEE